MKDCLCIAALGLLAASAFAGPELLPAKGAGYVTYDPATGKLTSAAGTERIGDAIWAATDIPGWYFASYHYGWAVLDWGDIEGPVSVGGFAFAYSTDLVFPERLDVIISFYANDNGYNTNGRTPLAAFYIPNLPAIPECHSIWIVTVDLEQAGSAFNLAGNDLDGDGLIDWSYVYWFQNLPAGSFTGPCLGYDPNVTQPFAPGAENAFDAFSDPNLVLGSYVATYWLGGDPFAQFYMELFDKANEPGCPKPGDSGKYCTADIWPNNGDGVWDYAVDGNCMVNLQDIAQKLGNFGMTSGATHEDGDVWPENGDGIWEDGVDGDGRIDLADLAESLGQYGDDCNGPRS